MQDCKILLDHPTIEGACHLFSNPKHIISCNNADQLEADLRRIEHICQTEQLYAAGFIAYEAGLAFEQCLTQTPISKGQKSDHINQLPLLKFGLFHAPELLNKAQTEQYLTIHTHGEFALENIKPLENKRDYCKKIEKIKQYIEAGDIYQANYTFQVELGFSGDLMGLYAALKRVQPTQLGGLLGFKDFSILSLSPELFFKLENDNLLARPMKGTAPRGHTNAKDNALKNWLYNDPKNRAENLMIVDLLRNDLSKISEIGSVKVDNLYDIETYDSLFQMTTSIHAKKRSNIGFPTLVKSLFPCGSITGAPKIRAMQIIQELENDQRGVYCGSIGYLCPNGDAYFNVAIRTITALKATPNILKLGIGSGIIHDSVPKDEYQECLLKMKYISELQGEFQLIESFLYADGYAYLQQHLDRLCTSSNQFGFQFNKTKIIQQLTDYAATLDKTQHYKVRLLLFKSGKLELSSSIIANIEAKTQYNIALSEIIIEKSNIFTRHKTTKRSILDQARQRMQQQHPDENIDEVIFCNRQGYITEGSYTNFFIEQEGIFYTPPLSAGLLSGVLRRYLLDTQPEKYKIKNIKFIDLNSNDKLWVGNSVRGLIPAKLLD